MLITHHSALNALRRGNTWSDSEVDLEVDIGVFLESIWRSFWSRFGGHFGVDLEVSLEHLRDRSQEAFLTPLSFVEYTF